jgi:hypothetical protein
VFRAANESRARGVRYRLGERIEELILYQTKSGIVRQVPIIEHEPNAVVL